MSEAESITDIEMKTPDTALPPRSRTEPDLQRHAADLPPTTALHFDSLDDSSGRGLMKLRGRGPDHPKLSHKVDNRARHNIRSPADMRWPQPGVGDHHEKLEKSQNDLTGSRWAEYGHRTHGYGSNSSESDIFPSRGVVSSNPNESSYTSRPSHLFKSSSSSQLPCVRSNASQASRPWRYGTSSAAARPISLVSMQQTLIPLPIAQNQYLGPGLGRTCCGCSCEAQAKRNGKAESVMSLADDPETREGLSWRRLHMSRAKLKATATTSELLSGFAMVAMVELQINKPTAVPEWLFVMFAVCTTVLVSVHIFALMISTYLLPNIDAVSKLHVSSLVTESPHDRMKGFIELAWAFSTILGLFLFLVEIAILCWVKFWDYSFTAAMSATMIVIPVLIVFVAFAMHFYHSLVVIKCKTSVSNIQELENMKKQLDNASLA